MSDETQSGVLTWMHLSDLHVGGEDWQRDDVLGALVRDLPGLLEERKLRPDLLFVTGDVANKGRKEEYDGAFVVLEEITNLLGLERREHVFLVPGNHDVDRGRVNSSVKRDHKSLITLNPDDLRNEIGDLIGDSTEFVRYGKRLTEWCTFTERFLGRARSVSHDRPWRADVISVGGSTVGVLSLCTAWASGTVEREDGSLFLGERQLRDMLAEASDAGAQVMIALMHHPLDWLHAEERVALRDRLDRDVDLVLHGHVHSAHSAVQLTAGSARATLGAGAAYAGLGQDRHHGFSIGRIDTSTRELEVNHFTWSTSDGEWQEVAGRRGRVSLSLATTGIDQSKQHKGGHEVLGTRLRHAAAKVYATVDFAGLGAGGPRRHVTLDQIFVPLHLAAKHLDSPDASWFEGHTEEQVVFERGDPDDDIPADAPEIWRGRYDAPEGGIVDASMRVSGRVTLAGLDAMLAAGRNVVVLGGPGSGKSTLAKYLASTTAAREGGPVPLLLPVRDWIAEGKREHLLDMAARQATTWLSVRTDREALEALCDSGRVMLIVDGVDEAADATVRRELRNQVHGFVTRFPRVPVLVTSRIAGYHEVPLDGDEFDELTLEPFDDKAIEQFVRRWYDLVEDDPAARLRKRVDLLHALEVEPRAKELARNPLLATLIGMVHFSHAQLPGDRAKLYGMMIELLLVTWPAERKRELPELHGTVQQPMLERLALRLQEQRASAKDRSVQAEVLVDVDRLESLLEELLRERFPERSAPERRHLARKWGKWLVDGSGLLQEQQPGRVGFLHLSLMEFLAGRALLEQSLGGGYQAVAALVAARHRDAVWRETLLLMLGSENKNRELGQTVLERLLADEAGKVAKWSTFMFGLALLREEVDMGEQREHLLTATCRAAVDVAHQEWYPASERLGDIVRFSKTHRQATRKWLEAGVSEATGKLLVGILALAGVSLPWAALPWEDVRPRLDARSDKSTVVLTLLDFGPHRSQGIWAREKATKDIWASWAGVAPLTAMMPRSLESFEHQGTEDVGGIWIAPLLIRAYWMAKTIERAAERLRSEPSTGGRNGLPAMAWWGVPPDMVVKIRLDPSLRKCCHGAQAKEPPLDFAQPFADEYFRDFVQDFVYQMSVLSPWHSLLPASSDFVSHFVGRTLLPPELFVVTHLSEYVASHVSNWLSQDFASEFALTFARDFKRLFSYDLKGHFSLDFTSDLTLHDASESPRNSIEVLSEKLQRPRTRDDAIIGITALLSSMIAEAHAGLVAGLGLEDPNRTTSAFITLRLQNRWLNLFFAPLVEYATKTRPLPVHPDLHALLLTYGLVQYQTTWQWPDCPHWRSWFSSPPPAHWLPAHVWHLVRSIQDPTDLTHREHADACLDRNDWPELAQALRDNTLVPTPPEVLALFDRGTPPDDQPAPS